jgi:hypothetical protein
MGRKPPPPHQKGIPRTPGSGRKRGTPNKRTVALRELMAALSGDVFYQQKLQDDFRKRRVHPSVEVRVWEYAIGRPKEHIELSAEVSMKQRLDAERERLRWLDVGQLQALLAESEALFERAIAQANAQRTLCSSGEPKELPARNEANLAGERETGGAEPS